MIFVFAYIKKSSTFGKLPAAMQHSPRMVVRILIKMRK